MNGALWVRRERGEIFVGSNPVDQRSGVVAAVKARRERAALKADIRSGKIGALKVLAKAGSTDKAASTLRVSDFLKQLPGLGEVKAAKIQKELEISESKRLGGLGAYQRKRLREYLLSRSDAPQPSPKLVILAGPTAVGKGTVSAYIRQHYPEITISISATTRKPRPGEVDGRDYFFVTHQEFDAMAHAGELLEWAVVHQQNKYGTPKSAVDQMLADGQNVLLEIDLQGARQVIYNSENVLSIFLMPPSWGELVRRLEGRGTEEETERIRRLETAKVEMAAAPEFDYLVVNDEVARAAEEVVDLIRYG
ncbi:MAG: guanylate kinase [Microbacteriaceae bacterium]|nr:guanylate kinase [Microbacteriaceae bacterium]